MAKAKLYRWKLVRGIHSHGGKVYGKDQPDGDVIETTQNLGKSMNSPGSIRVIKLEDEDEDEKIPLTDAAADDADEDDGDESLPPDAKVTEESLNALSKAALVKLATEKDIPLGKAKTKAAMIAAILFGLE